MPYKKSKSLKRKTMKHKARYSRKSIRKHYNRNSRRKFIGSGDDTGNNIRYNLVTMCKRRKWVEYDNLTKEIIKDYWNNRKSNFLDHLYKNFETFSPITLSCLKRCLYQLQDNSIPESIPYLYYILCKTNERKEYDAFTQKIMKDYWVNGKKDFFIYLDENIQNLTPEQLSCLKLSLTQLQEDAIPESMPHLHYIMQQGL